MIDSSTAEKIHAIRIWAFQRCSYTWRVVTQIALAYVNNINEEPE
jgi:hypothetical protein